MKKYYKVKIYSNDKDLTNYNRSIIVEKGLLYAKEIVSNTSLMICDNDLQGSMYDYYVLSKEFNDKNIARYDEVCEYIEKVKLTSFLVYSKNEAKKVKKLIKEIKKK